MKRRLLVFFGCIFLLVLVVISRRIVSKYSNLGSSPTPSVNPLLIATDPSFSQLVGKYYAQIPNMPVYPDAVLVGSAKTNPENVKDSGYRVLWKSNASVPEVMKWASEQFSASEWKVDELGDPDNSGEQVMKIENDTFTGTFSAEHESEKETNIIVQILYK